jgi:hypothetical protein
MMHAVTTSAPAAGPRRRRSRHLARLKRRLSALATAAAERLGSPYRDVPPEFYRFPPF